MPRPPKPAHLIKPNGRPQKAIDWDMVDDLLIAGCMGTEIAPHFDMHYQTFYDRVCLEKGMGFTEYSQQKKEQGNSILRKVQFKKASEGDNTLLIWLGKNRLKQKETESDQHFNPEDLSKFIEFMKSLGEHQNGKSAADNDHSARSIDDIKINEEHRS